MTYEPDPRLKAKIKAKVRRKLKAREPKQHLYQCPECFKVKRRKGPPEGENYTCRECEVNMKRIERIERTEEKEEKGWSFGGNV